MSQPLDSPQACQAELSDVNAELAVFAHEWAAEAGMLKEKLSLYDRLLRSALRGIHDPKLKVAEKDAAAHAAVEAAQPGLSEQIESLEGKVEQHKTLFRTLERRASNAQSVLSAYKAGVEMERDGPPLAWKNG